MSSRRCEATWTLYVVFAMCIPCILCNLNCDLDSNEIEGLPNDACAFNLNMKGAKTSQPDKYMCSGYSVMEDIYGVTNKSRAADGYIVKFDNIDPLGMAHHINVQGCQDLDRKLTTGTWECPRRVQECINKQMLFSGPEYADTMALPKDVGLHIGAEAEINYLVLQIHYKQALTEPDYSGLKIYLTEKRQTYVAGMYIVANYHLTIPQIFTTTVDASCNFEMPYSIVPFAIRTHSHNLGYEQTAYRVYGDNFDQYELIGKGNPLLPQNLNPVEHLVTIKPKDKLALRCAFNSTGRNTLTHWGLTNADEMCTMLIMYYTHSSSESSGVRGGRCLGNSQASVFNNFPEGSDTPLPLNPDLEDNGSGRLHHNHVILDNIQTSDDDDGDDDDDGSEDDDDGGASDDDDDDDDDGSDDDDAKFPELKIKSDLDQNNKYSTYRYLNNDTQLDDNEGFVHYLLLGVVIPVIVLIIVAVLVQLYVAGHFGTCWRRSGKKVTPNLGYFLRSHKDFHIIKTDDDYYDSKNDFNDSDNEEFKIVRKDYV